MKKTEIQAKAAACSKCGKCRQVCPTFLEERSEILVARGRIHLADALENGTLKATSNLKKAATTCLLCLRCSDNCPNKVDIENIIVSAREMILDKKSPVFLESFIHKYVVSRRRPLALAAKMMGFTDEFIRLSRLTGIYRRLLHAALEVDPKRKLPRFHFKGLYSLFGVANTVPGNTRKAVYFPGCSATLSLLNLSGAVIRTLLRNGTDVVLPRFGCCGMPAYASGFREAAQKAARAVVRLIKETGANLVITSCGSCGRMLRDIYPAMLGSESHGVRVMDVMEYLAEIPPSFGKKAAALQVTYHDPCHLRRGMKVYEQPRVLLKSVPGVDFVEMSDADACCGCGGAFSLKYYDLSKKVRNTKLNMVQRTHAQVLATGCPACIMHLEDGAAGLETPVKVVHPVELIDLTFQE
jgi:glycolate oxidase iron-sulfur subunit